MPDTPAFLRHCRHRWRNHGDVHRLAPCAPGRARVTLLERTSIASGASGRTGALLRQHYTNRQEAMLAHHSLAVFRTWSEIVGGACGFDHTGLLVTIPTGPTPRRTSLGYIRTSQCRRSIGIDYPCGDPR